MNAPRKGKGDGGLWFIAAVTAICVLAIVALNARGQAGGGVACMVHYQTDTENAIKRAIGGGFQNIRNMTIAADWEPGQSSYNCNHMREVARKLNREGKCLSYYSGDFDLSDSKCRVYRFTYDRYIGPIGDLGRR